MSSVGPPDRQMRPGDALPGNLDNVRVLAGTKFEVICKIPDPRTPVAWTKDGQPLNSPVPRFPSIAKSDSGVYTCRSGDQEYTVLVDVVPRNVQGTSVDCYSLFFQIFFKQSKHIECLLSVKQHAIKESYERFPNLLNIVGKSCISNCVKDRVHNINR